MSSAQILLLGAVAGATIFVGLPMGRLQSANPALKAFFSATATGILLFLFWDVLEHAIGPVQHALTAHRYGRFSALSAVALGGFAAGLLGLVFYDAWMKSRQRRTFLGPGAAATTEFESPAGGGLSAPRSLALFIATGIGLHNFSEGLAIGQSAAKSELSLAVVLVIGFALHNATEGFGIVAPMAGDAEAPSWRFLGLLGLVGGAPTFVGTVIGQSWVNETVSVAFLALAAGSILYVVVELLHVCRRFTSKAVLAWGLLLGLTLGFATDFILVAAGV